MDKKIENKAKMNILFDFDKVCSDLETHSYTMIKMIGVGGFAKVYLVYSSIYKQQFAAKIFPRDIMNERSQMSFETETNALKSLYNQHIIYTYDSFATENYFFIIMEYCPYDSVHNYVKDHGPFEANVCLNFFHSLLSTLKIIHEKGFAHLDIKPQNILIDKHGRLKISDFGLSSVANADSVSKTFCGSVLFMSPEMVAKSSYNPFESDVWSLGVTFYYMAQGQYPWSLTDATKLHELFQKGFYITGKDMNPKVYQLLNKMLVIDPHHRATCEELLDLDIFKSLEPVPRGSPFLPTQNKLPPLLARRRSSSGALANSPVHKRSNSLAASKPMFHFLTLSNG